MLLSCTLALSVGVVGDPAQADPATVDLSGTWSVRLDPNDIGVRSRWQSQPMPLKTRLPGSLALAGLGSADTPPGPYQRLSITRRFAGVAWYSRSFRVPDGCQAGPATLFLERCHWKSQAWLDGRLLGDRDSLSTPHQYECERVGPGRHTLVIRVDNRMVYDVGAWAHSVTDETQTNWNGIIGRMDLARHSPTRVTSLRVDPDALGRALRITATISSSGAVRTPGRLCVTYGLRGSGRLYTTQSAYTTPALGVSSVEVSVRVPKDVPLWDEFVPAMVDVDARWRSTGGAVLPGDTVLTSVGLRQVVSTTRKRILLNGRPVFLRGTLECCIFPKTGFPPTSLPEWSRIFRICRSYGLNHVRFHSWCPPEAAFRAADSAGFLLQVEAPFWVGNWGKDARRDAWAAVEVRRILETYGNHPSFALMSMGNEPGGDLDVIHKLVSMAKSIDRRHLYTSGSGWGAGPDDDFHVTPDGRGVKGPSTESDLRGAVEAHSRPIVEHEVGQWALFPRLDEQSKYTGVTRALNFGHVQASLTRNGLLSRADQFVKASGALSVSLYKEEIESILRTPGHGGFALLDLHDFPGQGTSLVGVLDAFWGSKGVVTPAAWREFCGPVVPLARFAKRVYTPGETFTAACELANYGPGAINRAAIGWSLRDSAGNALAVGRFAPTMCETGGTTQLGVIEVPLSGMRPPFRATLEIEVRGLPIRNRWDIWVLDDQPAAPGSSVAVADRLDANARQLLHNGGTVLLAVPRPAESVPARYTSVFWNPVLFPSQPWTMGIWCDPSNQEFGRFPTGAYTDWLWWDLLNGSRALVLDELPMSVDPLVGVVDGFTRNHRLAMAAAFRIGRGRVLLSTLPTGGSPTARQLTASLLTHMATPAFAPTASITMEQLERIVGPPPPPLVPLALATVQADSEDPANPARNAIDGDPATLWHTQWGASNPGLPHALLIDLGTARSIAGLRYWPRADIANGLIRGYQVFVADTAGETGRLVATGEFADGSDMHTVMFKEPARGRFVRFLAVSGFRDQPWASVAELELVAAP